MPEQTIKSPEGSEPIALDLPPISTIEELDRRRRALAVAIDALRAKVKVREETEWAGGH